MTPKDHDFDWVKARLECSLFDEFVCLRSLIEKNVKQRQDALPPKSRFSFQFKRDGLHEFSAIRYRCQSDAVTFSVSQECSHILVQGSTKSFRLTVTLNDDGECRFRINGEKEEYLSWQVARKSLEDLFVFEEAA